MYRYVRGDEQERPIENPDEMAFKAWLKTAKPGETYIYYVGHLGEARLELTTKAEPGSHAFLNWETGNYQYFVPREPVNHYAETVWASYMDGKVELTQKRDGDVFQYRATKRENVRPNHYRDWSWE